MPPHSWLPSPEQGSEQLAAGSCALLGGSAPRHMHASRRTATPAPPAARPPHSLLQRSSDVCSAHGGLSSAASHETVSESEPKQPTCNSPQSAAPHSALVWPLRRTLTAGMREGAVR
eukprot:7328545-Prymnesium_polylepis.2